MKYAVPRNSFQWCGDIDSAGYYGSLAGTDTDAARTVEQASVRLDALDVARLPPTHIP